MIGLTRTRRASALVGVLALIGGLVGAVAVESPAFAAKVPGPPVSVVSQAGPAVGVMSLTWAQPTNLATSAKINYYVATATDNGAFGAPVSVGILKKATMPCSGVVKCSFRVYANTKGGGTGAASATVVQPWTAPSSPVIVNGGGGPGVNAMTLSWLFPTSTGGRAVTGYLYDVQVNSTGSWLGPFVVSGAPLSAALPCASTLASGGCSYRLYARNTIGTSAVSASLAAPWHLPAAPVINSVTPGRPAHAATINWHPGTTTGGLANTYTYEVSADGGPFVAGTGPIPASPTIATVDCNAVTICSYRLTATNGLGASPVSNTVSTGFNAPTATRTVTSRVSNLNLGSGVPTVAVSWLAPVSLGGAPIIRYEGRRCDGNCDESNAAWASAPVEALGTTGTWSTTCAAGLVTCSYEVRAVNGIGPGPWGSSSRIAPFAPTNVTASTAAPAGNVSISWTGPAEGGQGINHYTLYYCVTSTGCMSSAHWQDTGVAIPAGAQSAVHNCGDGVQCTYKLAAVENNSGASGVSSASAAATGSASAGAPQNLTAASGTSIGAVNLAWVAPADAGTFPVIDYVFQRSVNSGPFSAPISTGGTATSYVDTACGASNFCTYQVAAVTLAGTGAYSNTATAEGANVPSAPLTLNATPGGTFGAVDLTWQAPLDNGGWPVTGYFVERSLDGGSTWPQSWTLGTSPSYTDTTCGAGTSCTYRVSAINARGTGPASNTATAIGTNLSAPLNLTANTSTTTLGGVVLAWDPPASDSGFPIQGYEFRFKVGAGAFGAWADTGTLTGPRTFTQICGQDNTCTYEVRAYNAIGTSGPSNDATAAGLTDHTAPTVTITAPTNGQGLTGTTPTITGTAGNALGDSTSVNVTVKQGVTLIRTLTVSRSGTSWSVGPSDWSAGSPTTLADGAYSVTATQTDWATNTGTSSTVGFTIDNLAPSVTIANPSAGPIYTRSGRVSSSDPAWPCTTPGICGTSTDAGSGVSNVKVSVRQGTGNYWDPTTSTFSSPTEVFCTTSTSGCLVTGATSWNVAFPISNFPAGGSYTARAVGQDAAGNTSTGTSVTFDIDYDPANTVFVATTGISANSGLTPAAPKPTISEGLTVSATSGRTVIAIATGSYTGGLSISGATLANRKLLGGFSSASWLRAAPNSSGNGTTVTGSGTGISVSTTTGLIIQTLDITATATATPGDSTYGLRTDSSASVTLAGVSVTAASGVAGVAGANGAAGADGVGGSFGTNGHDGNCNDGVAGSGGSGAGGTRNGGSGGAGGCGNTTGTPGSAGTTSGNGNTAGAGGGGSGNIFCTNASPGGGGGGATTGGAAGTPGGAAGTAPLGTASLYTPTGGASGNAGAAGHGGGGGGGGGGHQAATCSDPDRGGGGGGGGGGGAGATAGTGGGSGGGSFGIYSVNSTVTLDTSVSFVQVTAGNGGSGGVGGNGAKGGSGGAGGQGGGLHHTGTITSPTLSEGNNPSGSPDGGPGGGGGGGSGGGGSSGGGGGAGGPALSAYHAGSGALTVGTATLARGSAGSGGTAGSGGAVGSGGAAGPIPAGSYTTGVNAGTAGATGTGGTAPGGTGGPTGTVCRFHNGGSCVTP